MEHVRWIAEPTVRQPRLVAAFTGWNDAGDAASEAIRHLIASWDATLVAEFDAEEFTDFGTTRPRIQLTPERTRVIVWPTVGLWSASTPGGDVLLLLGPEPSLRWRLFADQILAIVEKCGVSMVLSLGALLADVAHTRPVQVVGTAADQSIIDRYELRRSTYEGPTGIVGVLHDACVKADVPSASLWAAVPAYASQVPSPKASLALVERACEILGTPAPLLGLVDLADGYETRVSRLVQDDSDLIGYISRLEDMSDGNEMFFDESDDDADDDYDDDPELEVDHDELAEALTDRLSTDELMAEVEQFLRDQGDTGSGPR